MRVLWDHVAPMTASQVVQKMPRPATAHTTILTALERLTGKGLVHRVGHESRAITFAPRLSEREFVARLMIDRLVTSRDRPGVLLQFAGTLDPEDLEVLRRALNSDE